VAPPTEVSSPKEALFSEEDTDFQSRTPVPVLVILSFLIHAVEMYLCFTLSMEGRWFPTQTAKVGTGRLLAFTYRGLEVRGNVWLYGLVILQGVILPVILIVASVWMGDVYIGLTGIIIFISIVIAFLMQYTSIAPIRIVVDDEKIFYLSPQSRVCIPWLAVNEFRIEANRYRLQAHDGRYIFFTTRLVGYDRLVEFIQSKVGMWKRHVDVRTGRQANRHAIMFNILITAWTVLFVTRQTDYTAVFFVSVCLCLGAGLFRERRQLRSGMIDHCFL